MIIPMIIANTTTDRTIDNTSDMLPDFLDGSLFSFSSTLLFGNNFLISSEYAYITVLVGKL